MSELRVGDRVIAISESNGWGEVVAGDIGTINRMYGDDGFRVNFPAQPGWACRRHDLMLVKPRIEIKLPEELFEL